LASKRSNNRLSSAKFESRVAALLPGTQALFRVKPYVRNIKDAVDEIIEKRYCAAPNRVLMVTGGCGFIGSNFINYWTEKYKHDTVVNIDRLDKCSDVRRVKFCDRHVFIHADICDSDRVLALMRIYNVTHIVNFAAESHVDNSFKNSMSFTHSNVMGTHSMLECAKNYGQIFRFLHISTDEVYGEIPTGTCSESSMLAPTNPYAATKAAAEFLVKAYVSSFKLPALITRGNNVYGILQYPEKVVPRFMCQLINGEKITIHGQGSASRNFIYVSDTVTAVEKVLLEGEIGKIYNIGSDEEKSVLELARIIHSMSDDPREFKDAVNYVPDRVFNDCRYAIDSSALIALGWSPTVSWTEGIVRTWNWYKKNYPKGSTYE
jgi:dTDP-glucose 4,6-dehydratase